MDLRDVDLLEDTWATEVPHEAMALLRREAPVFWHPERTKGGPGFWAVTRHEDIRAISRDTETFSSERGGTFISDPTPEGLAQMRLTLLNMDPPHHHRYRRLVSRGFTPRQIRKLEEQIAQRATSIVDEICHKGEIDFVADVAVHMPAQVICDMIGVPPEDQEQIVQWTNTMVAFDDPYWQTTPEAGEAAAAEMFLYCDQLAERRRAEPVDDIMSILVHTELDGDRLTRDEVTMFFVILAVAGNETTRNLISHSVRALIEHHESRERLVADTSDETWDVAVEEFLRWGSSIHNFRRTATRDTVLRDTEISEGDKVVIYYISGNFDEDVFSDPFTFDIARPDNDHLTFGGGGVHYCLGANLARAEIKAMVREFVTRCPDAELTEEPMRMRSDFINGINRMPMRFTPSSA